MEHKPFSVETPPTNRQRLVILDVLANSLWIGTYIHIANVVMGAG